MMGTRETPARRRSLVAAISAMALGALAGPTAALGDDPTRAQYDDQVERTERQAAADPKDPGGTLPFTGTEALSLSAIALALGAGGLAARRAAAARRGDTGR